MLTPSIIVCSRCGGRCAEYRCRHSPRPDATGAWMRTVCVPCKRFIGYREIKQEKTRGKN